MIYNESKYNTHWNTKKLNQLGIFARGKSKHRPRDDQRLFAGGGYPLIQTGDVKAANLYISSHTDEYNDFGLAQSKMWNAGTLCITIAANIAETGILKYPMCFPDSVVGFNANTSESSELFMHYVFSYIRKSIQASASGSIQDNINLEYLSQLDFKIPPKEYQDKIVGLLSAIDLKIESNTSICTELESMAKTIYDYWFTQFDFPNAEGKPYRSSGGKMVWNEQLKREIPEGWESVTVDSVLDRIPNTTRVQTSDYLREGKYPIIDQSSDYIAGFTDDETALLQSTTGFIVFGDHTRIVKYTRFPFARGADGTQVLKSNSARMPDELLYPVVSGIDLSNYGYARHFKFLKDSLIILPAEIVAHSFKEIVSPIYERQVKCYFENIELARLRDWLLPMLMNGQATI